MSIWEIITAADEKGSTKNLNLTLLSLGQNNLAGGLNLERMKRPELTSIQNTPAD